VARISLCIIARNEAHFIGACLEAAKHAVDEIIVVDTGSTDNTAALAAAAGAKVVSFAWEDNFAKARNACLPHATGDWVLLLDADEQLAPEAGAVLRKAVEVGGFDCAMLPLYDSHTLDTTPEQLASDLDLFKSPVYLHRLFRNDETLKWKNRIHESVTWLDDPTKVVIRLDAPIVHYGNVPEIRSRFDKDERNFRLIEKEWNEDPENLIMTAIYLSDRYRRAHSHEVKELASKTFMALVENFKKAKPIKHPRFLNVVSIYMWFQMRDQQNREALETLKMANEWGISHPNLTWLGGICLENLAYKQRDLLERERLLKEGLDRYQELPKQHGKVFTSEVTPGLTSWLAHLSLGRVYQRRGKPEKAHAHYEKALSQLPDADQSRMARDHRHTSRLCIIETMIDMGQYRDAMRLIRQSGDIPGPDLQILRADIYERTDNFKACLDIIQKLMATQGLVPFLVTSCEARLRELLSQINLYKGTSVPGSGVIGTFAAVLSGKSPEGLNEPPIPDDDRLARVVAFLRQDHESAFFAPFRAKAAMAALPKLCAQIQELLEQEQQEQIKVTS